MCRTVEKGGAGYEPVHPSNCRQCGQAVAVPHEAGNMLLTYDSLSLNGAFFQVFSEYMFCECDCAV